MKAKNESDKRKNLNYLIFNEARKDAAPIGKKAYKSDEDARVTRDGACLLVTERTRVKRTAEYTELTIDELEAVLKYLRQGAGVLDTLKLIKEDNKGKFATKAQKGKLHLVAMTAALHFAEMDVAISVGGKFVTGEELRIEMKRLFGEGNLKGAASKHLYEKWIHPKIHTFLAEGGLRYHEKYPTKDYYLNWHEITREEADVLIVRFTKIIGEIETRYSPVKPVNPSLN